LILIGKGSKIILEKNATIIISKKSIFTFGIQYDQAVGSILKLCKNSVLRLPNSYSIKRGCNITIREGGELILGNKGFINEEVRITVTKKIVIGPETYISFRSTILDSDDHQFFGKEKTSPVFIGSKCWIGASSLILKGSFISNNSVVAAGSVGTIKGKTENVLFAGNPAIEKLKNIDWNK
jgi:acetyltransferase-like isoleucine patch superfamily enzyme